MSNATLKVEIEGNIFQTHNSSKNYVDALRFMYQEGLLGKEEETVQNFKFIRRNSSDFKQSPRAINDSKTLWVSTYSDNNLKKKQIDLILNKLKINGQVVLISNEPHHSYADAAGSLSLYLNYEYLPAEQYAKILLAISGVYDSLANALTSKELLYSISRNDTRFPFPVCLEEVRTGNSISTKFSFSKRFLPAVEIQDSETIVIYLPKWTALLILSGLILNYGTEKYKDYLDIRLKELELKEKLRAEVKVQSEEVDKLLARPNPTLSLIQENIFLFQSQINLPNIKSVTIDQMIHPKK